MKYKILNESDTSVCIEYMSEDGKGCIVTRLKQPPLCYADAEADAIIRRARRERLNEKTSSEDAIV